METVRAFVGCLLDLTVTRRVLELQRRLRAAADARGARFRWVPAPNFHVTLRFLGDVDAGLTSALGDELNAACKGRPVARASVRGVSAFPEEGPPRVLFATFDEGAPELAALAAALDARLDSLGLPPRDHPFRAHLTLARCEPEVEPVARELLALGANADCGKAYVTEVSLYRSDLLRAGAEYQALHRASLGAAVR